MSPKRHGARKTKKAAKRGTTRVRLGTDHDQPVVIDNGPAEVEFSSPVDEVSGKKWKRKFTSFNHILVETTQDAVQAHTTHALKTRDELLIDLAEPDDLTKTETLIFSTGGLVNPKVTMEVAKGTFEKTSASRVKPVGRDLRITRIRTESGRIDISCVAAKALKFDTVRVTIVATPH